MNKIQYSFHQCYIHSPISAHVRYKMVLVYHSNENRHPSPGSLEGNVLIVGECIWQIRLSLRITRVYRRQFMRRATIQWIRKFAVSSEIFTPALTQRIPCFKAPTFIIFHSLHSIIFANHKAACSVFFPNFLFLTLNKIYLFFLGITLTNTVNSTMFP